MKPLNTSSGICKFLALFIFSHFVVITQAQKVLKNALVENTVITDPFSIVLSNGFSTSGYTFEASIMSWERYSLNLDNSRNYILSIIPQKASSEIGISTFIGTERHSEQVSDQITYFNGLGAPIQSINVNASPAGKDIVTFFEYDEFGREKFKFLPFTTDNNNGNFIENAKSIQATFYSNLFGTGTPAFSNTVLEPSPLNRILEQGAPGASWQPKDAQYAESGHTLKYEYGSNSDYDVLLLKVDNTGSCINSGGKVSGSFYYYPANELYKTIIKDESWITGDLHTTQEFKDKSGNTILKRTFVENQGSGLIDKVETYYVYDNYGLLRYVLSPRTLSSISFPLTSSCDIAKSLCYYYEYDEFRRMILKQLPGASPVYMVYDKRDRLVLTQDGKMRNEDAKKWMFTKYDDLNRPVLTGIYTHSSQISQSEMQAFLNNTIYGSYSRSYFVNRNNSQTTGYDDSSFPMISDGTIEYLSITYYDSYDFPGAIDFNENVKVSDYHDGDPGREAYYFGQVTGQITGNRVKVLTSNSDTWLTTTNYYDDRSRPIQICRDLFDGSNGGKESVSTLYDFTGKALKIKQSQTFGLTTTVIEKQMNYDHSGRLISTTQQIIGKDPLPVILNKMTYNELGQLHERIVGEKQNVDYDYNIRGWLTQINNPSNMTNDLFGMKLNYNDVSTATGLNTFAQFNGNIASMEICRRDNSGSSTNTVYGYGFTYDGLNRLIGSKYGEGTGFSTSPNKYNEEGISYDLNGNIKTLKRNNGGQIDNLTYTYINNGLSNQLQKVDDGTGNSSGFKDIAGDDYTYDTNGNLIKDNNKGIASIKYNFLNLPNVLSKDGNNSITYIYDAIGNKLCKETKIGAAFKRQYYCGSMEYNDTKELSLIHTDEGLVEVSKSGTTTNYNYEYYLKDHLGNVRIVFDSNGNLLQRTDYYPFGLKYDQYNVSTSNKYLYNGKELQDGLDINNDGTMDMEVNLYDYGARFYDPQIGRFTCLDPIADQFPHVTPYNYAENKVINCIDLWGLQAVQVSAGARGALPLFGPWGVSASFEFGLILDKNYDLVLYNTVSLGGSFGGALSVGINGTFYPTANSYKDLVGLGVDLGVSTPFLLSGQGNVSFSDNGPKGGGTLSYGFPTLSAGAAAYADVTFTNLMSDPINIKNVTASTISQISQMMKISPQYAKIILLLMRAQIEKEEEKKWAETSIMLPEVVVVGKKTKTLEQRIEDMKWQSVRPNAYGNTGRYNKPGRSCDQYYSDDFLKWYYGDTNKNEEKK